MSKMVDVCGPHRDQLADSDTTWLLTTDGKLHIGQGQRDLEEYVMAADAVATFGGSPTLLASPDPFGVHLRLEVHQRGREAATPPITVVVPVANLRRLASQLQQAITVLEEFEQL